MRAETGAMLAGAVVVGLLVAARAALVPAPPARASVPGVESLEALSRFLAADTGTAAGDEGSGGDVRLDRDPFGATSLAGTGPAETRTPEGSEWSVSAIMIADAKRIAIIDDRLVEAGDMVSGGARVLEIARDHVLIMGPDGVRRRVALNR